MTIEVIEARRSDLPVVENLVRFYVYDLSEYMGWDCPESGAFGGCDDLPQYWGHQPAGPRYRWPADWVGYPFVVRVGKRLAGFALVRRSGQGSPFGYEVGEFFVLRRFRRRGVGRHIARSLFDKFPGNWQVRQMLGNEPAQAFWRAVISEYTGGDFAESIERCSFRGMEMLTQRFNNEPGQPGQT